MSTSPVHGWATTLLMLAVGTSSASADEARSHLETSYGGANITLPVSIGAAAEAVTAYPIDARGETLSLAPGILTQARLGLVVVRRAVRIEVEGDVRGTPNQPDAEIARFEYEQGVEVELRKASARLSITPWLHASAGATTSHWGLGLIANDGAHGWTPGSARFANPIGGDRVVRASMAIGPALRAAGLRGIIGVDRVLGDDVTIDGDVAYQIIGAAMVGAEDRAAAGVYAARRFQDSESGGRLDAWAIDVTAHVRWTPRPGWTAALGGEAAVILGTTTLAPTLEVAEHDVRQLGAAMRATIGTDRFGGALDVLYASGDQNIYDDKQRAFRADPNYDMGLLLFRNVLAGQTGRGQVNASDPTLVGYPPMGADRVASRGSATNTVAVFPRAVWRSLPGLEVYGGPLVAFAPAPLVDPFNTRISGTARQNALGGTGGRFLGTELDAGARYRRPLYGVDATFGLEAGVFVPGNAFTDMAGDGMGPVYGARLLVRTSY